MIRQAYVHEFPRLWGRGLRDQIVHFTGRTTRWFRYDDDLAALRDYIVRRPLDFVMFEPARYDRFRGQVDEMRQIFRQPVTAAEVGDKYYQVIEIFHKMYPFYTFSVFFAGSWRDDFLRVHGEAARPTVDMIYEQRAYSEGLVKETDLYFRHIIGLLFEERGISLEIIKVLRRAEVEQFLRDKNLPDAEILAERLSGYVYKDDNVVPVNDFIRFLCDNGIDFDELSVPADQETLKGSVAWPGNVVQGRVQVLMNSDEIRRFRPGSVLVTPMTSPEYLSAMRQAAAIITDEGGVTCHAAITARELKIPCIIGTRFATKILEHGSHVEIDARRGIIKKI